MIRTNPLAVALVSILFVLALACSWCAGWWFLSARELQTLRYQYQWMNKTSTSVQSLANEALDYSRRNPSIDPILQQFEVKPRSAPASAAPAPAAGSSAKPVR